MSKREMFFFFHPGGLGTWTLRRTITFLGCFFFLNKCFQIVMVSSGFAQILFGGMENQFYSRCVVSTY